MNPKSFLFIGLWIQPIKALPLGQRWNVMEAETAHEDTYANACNAMHPVTAHEDSDVNACNVMEAVTAQEDTYANACNAMHPDAPSDIISESVSVSVSRSVSEKKSTSSPGVRVRETTSVSFMPNNMLPSLLVLSKLCNFAVEYYHGNMKLDTVEFARTVREIVAAIPPGKVATYGDVAALAGAPSHARLVGKILGCIGMDSDIPCHRVVNCQGRPAPHWISQAALLRDEGVEIGPTNHVNLRKHRWNPLPPE